MVAPCICARLAVYKSITQGPGRPSPDYGRASSPLYDRYSGPEDETGIGVLTMVDTQGEEGSYFCVYIMKIIFVILDITAGSPVRRSRT